MSLPHALLTSLLEKSSSGYDLARRFDRSIGYFWHATHQQIYRELGRMERDGWIAALPAEPGDRAGKKIYRVLEAGREELKRWAMERCQPTDIREELLVRLRAEAIIGPLGLEAELERHLTQHREKLQAYRAFEQRDFSRQPLSPELQLQFLVLKSGIIFEEGWICWAEEALAVLRAQQQR